MNNSSTLPFPARPHFFVRLTALSLLVALAAATASAIPMVATNGTTLVKFDTATPGTTTDVAISGLQAGETLVGLDYRPATGQLFGIGTTSRVYLVNAITGAASPYAPFGPPSLNGTEFGTDVNPVVDRIRLVSNTEQNIRLDPNTGTIAAVDSPLNPAGNVVAVAYTNNFAGATQTTLYGIDSASGQLVRIGSPGGTPDSPNSGAITNIGSLNLGTNLQQTIGFDITPNGLAYATITTGAPLRTRLYLINLEDGSATSTGLVGAGTTPLNSLAALAGPIIVTNTENSGKGSLRQAIIDSNFTLSADDTIKFNIPGPGPHIIALMSALPPIIDRVTIDGTSEPDFSPNDGPAIVLDGSAAGAGANGLTVAGSGAQFTTIRGLQIRSFSGSGISIEDAPNTQIVGNYIGTDGTASFGNGDSGVKITGTAFNALIGGNTVADRNVIAGNGNVNVRIMGSATSGATVRGNFIGLNAAGTAAIGAAVGSTGLGVFVQDSGELKLGGADPGAGNVISGHIIGVRLIGSQNPIISGNYIGTNAAGTAAVGNLSTGIDLDSSGNILVGGTGAARNLISGNGFGITVTNGAANVTIMGNFIGTDAAGAAAVGNGFGIFLDGGGNTRVGLGSTGNVISGNGVGIRLRNTNENIVRANFIGTAADGVSPLGNKDAGIRIDATVGNAATENGIGGGEVNNIIAFNSGPGVLVLDPGSSRNSIRGNSIYANDGLGIDLNGDGVTANDTGDADTGPNQLQNYPVLSTAKNDAAGTTTIQGTLNVEPGSEHLIDFYTSDAADPSGHGEGRTFLGTLSVGGADPAGNIPFTATFAASAGQVLTATATRSNGDTSEFSPAITITGPVPARLANISTRLRVETGDRVLIGGFIIDGNAPKKVIVRAIGPSAGVPGALADPALDVYDKDNQIVASNNNWRDNGNAQEISDSMLAPNNDLEAAFLGALAPGAYTAVVSGVGDTTGVGLVEVYDLDQGADARLANIATRGFVQTGDDAMIGGLIITGETQLRLLVRGLGPTLDINGKLADPTLELFNANGDSLAFNNNWRDTQEAEINETTIPPPNDVEPAILATLPAANYTAVLRGLDDTIGIAVVEIYNVTAPSP